MTRLTPARLAAVCTAIVFVAAWAISWDALMALARGANIRDVLAPCYPALVDGMMLTGTVAAVVLRGARLRTRAYTWTLIGAGIAVSVIGNSVHAQAHGGVVVLPAWGASAASAVPALSLAASLHLLVLVLRHGRTTSASDEETIESRDKTEPAPPQETAQEPPQRRERVSDRPGARTATLRRVERLLASRPNVTSGEAAKRVGISRAHAARLLRQARQLHVVNEAEEATR